MITNQDFSFSNILFYSLESHNQVLHRGFFVRSKTRMRRIQSKMRGKNDGPRHHISD